MKHAVIVRGAKRGDEGKGHIVEALAARTDASLVVRDVGGAQAYHNVVLQNGTWHGFKQFGSATFQGVPTLLSKHFVVDPFELLREAKELESKGVENPQDLMYIHKAALIATPMHKVGDDRWRDANPGISTCGMGVGEARWLNTKGLRITVGDIGAHYDYNVLRDIQEYYGTTYDILEMVETFEEILSLYQTVGDTEWHTMRNFSKTIIFEGAQGALLDATRGDVPYVTSSNTSYENALEMLEGYKGSVTRIAVMRSYETCHGNNPNFVEDPGMTQRLLEAHNQDNNFQGRWRAAPFSLSDTKRGLEILKGTDCIAMTHLDRWAHPVGRLEQELGIPIRICSWGATKEDVEFFMNF